VLNWLPNGRPLLLTVPATGAAEETATGLTAVARRLTVDELTQVAAIARTELTADPHRADRLRLIGHYFSHTTDGAATAAFVATCEQLATSSAPSTGP